MKPRISRILVAMGAGLGLVVGGVWVASAAEPLQGVTANEIVIGTNIDLSGVTAVQGVNNSDAIRMAFDDANAKGGINGRKIRYIVEDNQYTVPRAVQAMNKLLNLDHIFIAVAARNSRVGGFRAVQWVHPQSGVPTRNASGINQWRLRMLRQNRAIPRIRGGIHVDRGSARNSGR